MDRDFLFKSRRPTSRNTSTPKLQLRRSRLPALKLRYAYKEATAAMEERHLGPQDRIPCPRSDCCASLPNVCSLQYHLELHDIERDEREPRHLCHGCHRSYETRRERRMHVCAPRYPIHATLNPLSGLLHLVSRVAPSLSALTVNSYS